MKNVIATRVLRTYHSVSNSYGLTNPRVCRHCDILEGLSSILGEHAGIAKYVNHFTFARPNPEDDILTDDVLVCVLETT